MSTNAPQPGSRPGSQNRNRSHSRSRDSKRPSRPTTPLRPSSRDSFRGRSLIGASPLDELVPSFQELDDAMVALHENFFQLQQLHESINKFNENFASLLYGLNMNAFCVDFVESPIPESFRRAKEEEEANQSRNIPGPGFRSDYDAETTFMTNDTFVEAAVTKPATRGRATAAPSRGTRGSQVPQPRRVATRGPRGTGRTTRPSGIARGRARYTTS